MLTSKSFPLSLSQLALIVGLGVGACITGCAEAPAPTTGSSTSAYSDSDSDGSEAEAERERIEASEAFLRAEDRRGQRGREQAESARPACKYKCTDYNYAPDECSDGYYCQHADGCLVADANCQ